MRRLYDKKDLAWNLDFWDRQEQLLHADIANGRVPASFLEHVISEQRQHRGRPCGKGCGCRSYKVRDGFDLERKRERMKLLRTGSLLRELDNWQRLFKACPHCRQMPKKGGGLKDVPCVVHAEGLTKAKSDVFWAGEHNLEERNARGQRRAEGVVTAKESLEGLPENTVNKDEPRNPLNKWEELFQLAKAEGRWPADAKDYDVEPTYRGWLEILLEEEEMTEQEYAAELDRLRQQARELEEMASLAPMGKLKRDGRHHATHSGYTSLT